MSNALARVMRTECALVTWHVPSTVRRIAGHGARWAISERLLFRIKSGRCGSIFPFAGLLLGMGKENAREASWDGDCLPDVDAPDTSHTDQFIVAALCRAGVLSISLAAEVDGEVVGHAAFGTQV